MSSDLSAIWKDLRRRRVFQVAAIYAASAWVIVQVADVIGPAIGMWPWVMTAIVGFAMVGFPIAVILAWLFDVGPGGVVRTKPGSATGILAIVISLGLLGTGTAGFVWLIKPGVSPDQVAYDFQPLANSVAVMPFVNISPSKDSEYFAEGIAEVLIHQLSAIAKLKVIASTSSFAFDRDDNDYGTIARKLRAERLLVGTVQRSGDILRISTQLIDSRTGESVWSELFDREGKDIFAVQDEIALAVAKEMNAPLAPQVESRVTRPITSDLDAYDLYLLGVHHMRVSKIDDGYAKSIDYFNQALVLDPNLALAWAALSSATFWHGTRGYIPFNEGLSESREYNARALAIDPQLAEAYAHLSFLSGAVDRDLDASRNAYDKAVELSPSYWLTYLNFGLVLKNHGRFSEAADTLEKGLQLQPFKPEALLRANLGEMYALSNEYDKGMRLVAATYIDEKGTKLEGQYIEWLANTALRAQRFDDAIASLEIAIRDGHDSGGTQANLAEALLSIGDVDSAARAVGRAEEIVAKEQAEGRHMRGDYAFVLNQRMLLDIARNDVESMLATTKDLMAKIAEGSDDRWAWFDLYRAGVINIVLGRYEEGAELMDQLIELLGTENDAENFALAAYAHQQVGNSDRAQAYLDEAPKRIDMDTNDWRNSPGDLVMAAMFHAMDGDVDESMARLERGYNVGFRNYSYLLFMPPFEPVRTDPRFIEIVRRMRNDTDRMRERVAEARKSGDWESIIARHFEN